MSVSFIRVDDRMTRTGPLTLRIMFPEPEYYFNSLHHANLQRSFTTDTRSSRRANNQVAGRGPAGSGERLPGLYTTSDAKRGRL